MVLSFQHLKIKYSLELRSQLHLGVRGHASEPSPAECGANASPEPRLLRLVPPLPALEDRGWTLLQSASRWSRGWAEPEPPGCGSGGWGHSGPALGGAGGRGSSGRSGRRTCCQAVPEAKQRWRRVRLRRRRRRRRVPGRRALGQAVLLVLLALAAAAAGSGRLSCRMCGRRRRQRAGPEGQGAAWLRCPGSRPRPLPTGPRCLATGTPHSAPTGTASELRRSVYSGSSGEPGFFLPQPRAPGFDLPRPPPFPTTAAPPPPFFPRGGPAARPTSCLPGASGSKSTLSPRPQPHTHQTPPREFRSDPAPQ